jgi:hypothetical protein
MRRLFLHEFHEPSFPDLRFCLIFQWGTLFKLKPKTSVTTGNEEFVTTKAHKGEEGGKKE